MKLIEFVQFILVVILAFVIINILKNTENVKREVFDQSSHIQSQLHYGGNLNEKSNVSMINFLNKFSNDRTGGGDVISTDVDKFSSDDRSIVNLNKYIERDIEELMNFSNNKFRN